MPSRTHLFTPTPAPRTVADYLLVMTTPRSGTGLPAVVGAIVAKGNSGAVSGEAVVGEGEVDVRAIDAAIELLRDLPGRGEASASEWLAGLAGVTNGTVRLTGPWNWDAQDREAIHWAMDEARLTARTVAIVRDGRVVPFPGD